MGLFPARISAAARPLAVLVCALSVGCSNLVSVKVAYDPSVPFRKFGTFAMAEPNRAVPSEIGADPFVLKRLRQLTFEQLNEKGLAPKQKEMADLIALVSMGSRQRVEVLPGGWDSAYVAGRSGYRFAPGWGWSAGSRTTVVDEGIIVIDLVDRRENAVVYRGTGLVRASRLDDDDLREVVTAVLARFPPDEK